MSHGAQPVALAQDLVDIIMDEVDDKSSLAACSLVSRSWMHGSSRHLFRTLSSRKDHPQVLGPTKLDEVDALLVFLATCSRARNAVQDLTLKSTSLLWGSGTATHTAETVLWNLSRLPQLKSLVLDHVSLGGGVYDPSLRFGPPPLHPATQPSLELVHSAFDLKLDHLSIIRTDGFGLHSSHLARFLGGFSSIKELWLNPEPLTTWASTTPSPQSVPRANLLQVQQIVVRSDSMLQFLLHSLDPRFLTVMILRLGDEESFQYVHAFLETFTRIESAIIGIPWMHRVTGMFTLTNILTVPTDLISLAKLSNMDTLTICADWNDASAHFPTTDPRHVAQIQRWGQLWDAMIGMLASAAPSLRCVTFYNIPAALVSCKRRDPTGYLRQEQWDRLNAVLSSFPQLERVDMLIETCAELSDPPQIDAIRAKISEEVREKFHLTVTHP